MKAVFDYILMVDDFTANNVLKWMDTMLLLL